MISASPISITASRTPSEISVRCAVLTLGSRNAGTPLEIASTPVTAEHPDANAFNSNRIPTVSVAPTGILDPITATGCGRSAPTTIVARMLTTKIAVGSASSLADSAIPNMFTAVRISSPTRVMASRWCDSDGNTLPRLAAPAARLTATVST